MVPMDSPGRQVGRCQRLVVDTLGPMPTEKLSGSSTKRRAGPLASSAPGGRPQEALFSPYLRLAGGIALFVMASRIRDYFLAIDSPANPMLTLTLSRHRLIAFSTALCAARKCVASAEQFARPPVFDVEGSPACGPFDGRSTHASR